MRKKIDETTKMLLKDAAKKLTGTKKREFMAKTTIELFEGSARRAERQLGWSRQAVELGLNEMRTGIKYIGNYRVCGRKKTEEKIPQLEQDIYSLVDPESQADPELKHNFAYTRLTAKAVKQALIEDKGYREDQLPKEWALRKILNRLGYRLRKVKKAKPKKNSANGCYICQRG